MKGGGTDGRAPDRLRGGGAPGAPEPAPDAAGPTYYDLPAIKEPVWIWAVPAYLYAGGTAGAAAVLGAAAQSRGEPLRGLVSRCRWTAAAGLAAGTALLVHDLGRPDRFLNMLRVLRPTSPMSVGSWVLAGAGPLAAGAAALGNARGRLRRVGDAAGYLAGGAGMPLAGYTAVLLSTTAVPVWQEASRSLPALFTASAMAGAASLLELTQLAPHEERVVRRFGAAGKLAELAATFAVEREARRVERVARPLGEGASGALWRGSRALTAASVLLTALPGRSRARSVASGLLGTAGALALRFAVFHAGKASARDPRATFDLQRARLRPAGVTAEERAGEQASRR